MVAINTAYTIRPFQAQDMDLIQNGALIINLEKQIEQFTFAFQQLDDCVTGCVGTDIVCVVGMNQISQGVGNVWFIVTTSLDEYVYECINEALRKLIEDNNLHRIQSYGRVDFPVCHTVLGCLGFKVEGKARAYTPDKVDCIVYGKVL